MDKNLFITLLKRYTGSTVEEARELVSLKTAFPYSQILHTLSARVSKDHGFDHQAESLQIAAVHAADRNVLKEIIIEQRLAEAAIQRAEQNEREITESEKDSYTQSISSIDIADEVLHDLETLNNLRHKFEMMFVDYTEIKVTQTENEKSNGNEKVTEDHPADKSKSKKARIIELAKSMNKQENTEENISPIEDIKEDKKKDSSKKRNTIDSLIEEIRITKEEISPESEKQKEQIQIINEFIKIQPSISNPKERPAPQIADLNPVKSGEFGENIISETLVEILIKQGKKDKAIEVLKKLIWKYPQKKTYFASQIEDLKK